MNTYIIYEDEFVKQRNYIVIISSLVPKAKPDSNRETPEKKN